jgi:transposase
VKDSSRELRNLDIVSRYKSGESTQDLARAVGLHQSTVESILRGQGFSFRKDTEHSSAERNRTILERRKSGASLNVIAREFGITRERVRQIVDKLAPGFKPVKPERHACLVDGCERLSVTGYAYCRMHLSRVRKHGDPLVGRNRYGPMVPDRECSVPGCQRTAAAKGLCLAHYYRPSKAPNMDPNAPVQPRPGSELLANACSVDGCERRVAIAKSGLCRFHYDRLHRARQKARKEAATSVTG